MYKRQEVVLVVTVRVEVVLVVTVRLEVAVKQRFSDVTCVSDNLWNLADLVCNYSLIYV